MIYQLNGSIKTDPGISIIANSTKLGTGGDQKIVIELTIIQISGLRKM